MRIRKHRAWHLVSKEMIYAPSASIFKWLEEGQPIEVMDMTGLHDKNGKEIYEGDIVEIYGEKYPIEFVAPSFGMWTKKKEFITYSTAWEVIGNIYSNPELLK